MTSSFLSFKGHFNFLFIYFFGVNSLMFEIECILDEAVWDLAACQISTIISLLGWKQIRLGFPKVRGPCMLVM